MQVTDFIGKNLVLGLMEFFFTYFRPLFVVNLADVERNRSFWLIGACPPWLTALAAAPRRALTFLF
jgi:hypothetical protein